MPTVKIATNSLLAAKKPSWIDFNAGILVEGVDAETALNQFVDMIVRVANGESVCNERNGFRELAIFKSGVTL